MTSIDAISISGIRSFDPDPHNAQRIVFKKPLTVILGKNGAGKTTVIEALLNACTGAMPPGCGEKVSFIYDPKVANKSSVKAHIRLDITAKGGSKVSVIRKLESTKKNTKLSFSTLDSVIVLHGDEEGGSGGANSNKAISNSYRASDCDKMVPEFLGVSKAVLEHVVFCHQEDSNWPLQSPADVKAKFDDIFASSEYVAALDKLREVIKGYKQQRDADEVNLREYKGKREEAARLRAQIDRDKAASRTRFQQSREMDPKIRQVNEAIAALDGIAHGAAQTDREIATLDGRIEERSRANKDIADKGFLRNVQPAQFQQPQQTLGELKATRASFQTEARRIQQECADAEARLSVGKEARERAEKEAQRAAMDVELRQRADRDHRRRVEELKEALQSVTANNNNNANANEEGIVGGKRPHSNTDEESAAFVVGEAAIDEKALLRIEKKLHDDLAAASATLTEERAAGERATEAAKAELDVLVRELDADPPRRRSCEDAIKTSNRTTADKKALLERLVRDGDAILRSAGVPATVAVSFVPPSSVDSSSDPNVPTAAAAGPAEGNTARIVEYFKSTVADLEARIAAANATRMAGAWHKEEERLVAEQSAINASLASLRAEMSGRSAEAADAKRLAILDEQLASHTTEFGAQLAEATGFLQQAQRAQHAARRAAAFASGDAAAVEAADASAEAAVTPDGAPLSAVTLAFEALLRNREADLSSAHGAAQAADRSAAVASDQLEAKRKALAAAERSLTQQTATFKSALAASAATAAALGADAPSDPITTADNITAHIAHAQQRLMEATQSVSSLVAMRDCYEAFIATAEADHTCAVCERGLGDDAAVAAFVHTNAERQKSAPADIAAQKERCGRLERHLKGLKKAEPIAAQLIELERSTVPTLLSEINNELAPRCDALAAAASAASQRRHDAERSFREVQSFVQANIASLNSKRGVLSSVAVQQQSLAAALATRQREREQQQQQLQINSAVGASVTSLAALSLKEIEERHAAAMDSLNASSARLSDVRRERLAEERGLAQCPLKASLEAHQKGLFALGPLVQQCADVAADVRAAAAAHSKATAELRSLDERRQQLRGLLDAARGRLEKTQQAARKKSEAIASQVAGLERGVQTIAAASKQVKAYIANGEARLLQTDRDRLASARAAVDKELAAMAQIEAQIRDCRHFLDNQNKVVHTIDQQLCYFQNIEDARAMGGQRQHLEASLRTLKDDSLKHVAALLGPRYDPSLPVEGLRALLQSQHVALERDKAHHQGSIGAMEAAIQQAEGQLAHPDLERAEDNFMSSFVKLHTTDLVVKDLEKYFLALEKAIQSYHQEKIAQINQLIAEYWRQTYRGSDIDTIEIKAEDEVTASGAVNTRKSYKYRLVMRKGAAELDMRGRCSAGQKVLASVVIRLALSEAFCCDCGVLALDEPTTNMDEDNAQSLALALKDLIDARRTASNFQLIVITHDEAFVRALGGQNVVDTYYFVHKDRAGEFSVIEELAY